MIEAIRANDGADAVRSRLGLFAHGRVRSGEAVLTARVEFQGEGQRGGPSQTIFYGMDRRAPWLWMAIAPVGWGLIANHVAAVLLSLSEQAGAVAPRPAALRVKSPQHCCNPLGGRKPVRTLKTVDSQRADRMLRESWRPMRGGERDYPESSPSGCFICCQQRCHGAHRVTSLRFR